MMHAPKPGSGDPPDDHDVSSEATRILMPMPTAAPASPPADDGATRIMPARPAAGRPGAQPGQGVIGVAGQARPAAAEDDGRTMFMPVGVAAQKQDAFDPAVGWLVIVEGPGRGNHVPVFYGQNSMGRGGDQRIRLAFGDTRITRDAHAFLIYDDVARKYYVRDNGKANLVRLNGAPVMAPVELKDRDRISIGETVMLFVALCGENFDWLAAGDEPSTAPGA